jgi:hypothetical protein
MNATIKDSNAEKGSHGSVGRREMPFTRLFPARLGNYDAKALEILAEGMIGNEGDEPNNHPDGEENLLVPAGYTYFGQFIDHDLTFDTTSSLLNPGLTASNLRSPRLDLDCVYGAGPDDQPYLYAISNGNGVRKGASLVLGEPLENVPNREDLLRVGKGVGARAVIGDPRNDENSIVCNIQLAFIRFHNQVVAHLTKTQPLMKDGAVFEAARKLVRWTYQRIVIDDYLPRIVEPATYNTFRIRLERKGEGAFQLFTADKRGAIPLEFAGAAYRYGHSMVRTGYKLNADHREQFIFTKDMGANSLIGFGPLPADHWVEWKRFFPKNNAFKAGERPAQNNFDKSERLQWAYRIDTALVDPLKTLPIPIADNDSLARRNLMRGDLFGIVGGQTVAEALGVAPLEERYLVMRDSKTGNFGYQRIPEALVRDTPLWFYVLAEAQRELVDAWAAKNKDETVPLPLDDDDLKLGLKDKDGIRHSAPGSQLGPVGGMILLETFFGLLLADSDSVLTIASQADKDLAAEWFAHFTKNGNESISMWQLVQYAGLT